MGARSDSLANGDSGRTAFALVCAAVVAAAALATLFVVSGRSDTASPGSDLTVQSNSLIAAGAARYAAGDRQTAGRMFAAALVLQPGNARANYDLGTVRQAQGNVEAAKYSYRKALSTSPNFTEAIFNLAIADAATGNKALAIANYRRVLVLQPSNAAAMWNLGILLHGAGRTVAGLQLMKRATAIDPALRSRTPANVRLG